MRLRSTRRQRVAAAFIVGGIIAIPILAVLACFLLWLSDGSPIAIGAETTIAAEEAGGLCWAPEPTVMLDPAAAIAADCIAHAEELAPEEWESLDRLAQVRKAMLLLTPKLERRKGSDYVDRVALAISRYSYEQGLDWRLVVALMFVESSFEQYAKGPPVLKFNRRGYVRCSGLMQIHPDHGIDDLFGIESNCHAGCAILKGYSTDRKGSVNIDRGLRRYGTNVPRAKKYWRLLEGEFGS